MDALRVAKEFNATGKRFGSDLLHMKEGLDQIMQQKSDIIRALLEIEHDSIDEHHNLACSLVVKLEDLIRLEEKYLSHIKSKYKLFSRDAAYLKEHLSSYPPNTLLNLSRDYLATLEKIFSTLHSSIGLEIRIMEKEKRDIHKAKGGVFSRMFVQRFTDNFNSYLDDAKLETDIKGVLNMLKSEQERLRRSQARINMEYSVFGPIQVSAIVLIVDSIASGALLPAAVYGCGMLEGFRIRP